MYLSSHASSTNLLRYRFISIIIFLLLISLSCASSNAEVKGIAYLDGEKPYKSYVGKILPGEGGEQVPNGEETISEIIARYSHSGKAGMDGKSKKQSSKGRGRSMKKPEKGKKTMAKLSTKPKTHKSKGRALKKQKGSSTKSSVKHIKDDVTTNNKRKHSSNAHVLTKKKGKSKQTKTKSNGRTLSKGKIEKSDKSNWYFKDPQKLLGRAISNFDPSDPAEPRPSEKVKDNEEGEGAENLESKAENDEDKSADKEQRSISTTEKSDAENVDGENKMEDQSDNKSPSEPEGDKDQTEKEDSSKKKKNPDNPDDPNRKKPTVIEYKESDDMNPDFPGWFALKQTSQFGKPITLGTLLRRRGKGKARTAGKSDEEDDVDDAEDGENNDASERMSPALRKYDKACLWQEYQATKGTLVGPRISEVTREKVRWQNQQLSHFFMDIAFNSAVDDFGNSSKLVDQQPGNSFQLLHLTKEIFSQQICTEKDVAEEKGESDTKSIPTHVKDKILPKSFSETVFHLFLKLYELTKNKETTEFLSESEFAWIKGNLESCNQTGGLPKKILWYTDECKETVVAFDQENNYACTPYIEYDFNIKKYDPLLDFIWHMVASVHAHCFESFQSNGRLWHRYFMAMADLVTPEMRVRWSASSEDNTKLYTRFFGPNHDTYFDNMNRCMYAATLRSNVPYLLPRFEGNRKTRFAPYSAQQFNATEF